MLGLEVSRLARNNADWHRLLEICALSRTLICDEDGLYDPADFNDRLLLGLKGTMSEAELHFIRARLQGGILSKARRGELPMPLPVGLVEDPAGKVVLDPDAGVQRAVRHLLDTFARTGSARAVVQTFNRDELLFPARVRSGERKGELVVVAADALTRAPHPAQPAVCRRVRLWSASHPQDRRGEDHHARGATRRLDADPRRASRLSHLRAVRAQPPHARHQRDRARHGPRQRPGPRRRRPVARSRRLWPLRPTHDRPLSHRKGAQVPDYQCVRRNIQTASEKCQVIPGAGIDSTISQLLLDTVTPLALEVALNVQAELEARADEADHLRRSHVDRARQRAELARRRYLAVDPDNRLVADTLEADWNDALRAVQAAQDEYEHQTAAAKTALTEQHKQRIRQLASDFPKLWNDPATPARERKRIARLLIEDVTLTKNNQVHLDVRFRGGQTTTLTIPKALNSWQARQTPGDTLAEIDRLLDDHTDGETVERLNQLGHRSGMKRPFTPAMIVKLRTTHDLPSHSRAATRPRHAHPATNRRPARRALQHHPRLAARRTAQRPQGQRQERLALRAADPRRPQTRQTPRLAALPDREPSPSTPGGAI